MVTESNDVLTSAQMNTMDVDHANALDKTTAGDTIAGTVGFSGSGKVQANIAGTVIASIAGGISGGVAGGISGGVAGGIQSGVIGGINLTGGSTDWPTFSATRNRTWIQMFDIVAISISSVTTGNLSTQYTTDSVVQTNQPSVNGNAPGGFITNVANSGSATVWSYYIPIKNVYNGATLASITVYLAGAGAHGALPAIMPSIQAYRLNPPGSTSAVTLAASPSTDPTALLATYKGLHGWTLNCTQNNVIDTSAYGYSVVIYDEGSTNAVAGNIYTGMALAYQSIPNMAPP